MKPLFYLGIFSSKGCKHHVYPNLCISQTLCRSFEPQCGIDSKENIASEGYTAGRLPHPSALEQFYSCTVFHLLLGRDHKDLEQWVKKIVQSCKIV